MNTDGSLDETFVTGSGFDADIYTAAIAADSKILVGGSFGQYDGDKIGYGIARLIPPAEDSEEEEVASNTRHRSSATRTGDLTILVCFSQPQIPNAYIH